MLTAALAVVLLTAPPGIDAARGWRRDHGHEIVRSLADMAALPNVVQYDEGHPDLVRNARYLEAALRLRGVEAEVRALEGAPPIVLGALDVPGAERTIGIYVHYDGQPVDEPRWSTPPWQPRLFDAPPSTGAVPLEWPDRGEAIDGEWRLYGRATADDKAPIVALLSALDALRAADVPLTSNLRLLFEGEEEAGSVHLGAYMQRYRDRLDADVWLICDGPVHQSRRPQLVFGVRGITSMQITIFGADRYLHSGHYGNWAPNPGQDLALLLAGMKDSEGRVLVDGFYDDVVALTPIERQALSTVPAVDDQLRHELGLAASEGGRTLTEALLLPSLNIQGLDAGPVGPKARNVIPASATAAIDIRLVKGCDPARMLDRIEAHVRDQGYEIVRTPPDMATRRAHPRLAMIVRGGGYRSVRAPMDLPIVSLLREAAHQASGEAVVLMPSLGGSLPLYLFEEILEAPLIIVPIANHDNNQHGPDENLRIANLWYGVDLMAGILTLPSSTRASRPHP